MKTIDDFNFNKKTVLLRIDVNASLKNGKPEMNEKFVRHAKTIKELLRKKAKVVILAHQSRPGREDFTSLKSHARLLSKLVKVKFVDDVFGNKAVEKIKSLKPGEALMLENVRSVKEEYQKFKNNKMVNVLAGLADIYV
ncbi:phosphoglycerate kinase, partial [Candidatus Woesearchaeota archaeon]